MKKIIATLLGIMMCATVAFAETGPLDTMDKAFSTVGNPTVGIGDIPWQHKFMYKATEADLHVLYKYLYKNGTVDIFAWYFGGVFILETYFPDEDMWLNMEDYRNHGDKAYFLMEMPYTEDKTLVFLEVINDGDLKVDAVGIRNLFGNDRITGIRYITDEKPSIYSSVFKKNLSMLIHKYGYTMPIEHATIDMGDEIQPQETDQD